MTSSDGVPWKLTDMEVRSVLSVELLSRSPFDWMDAISRSRRVGRSWKYLRWVASTPRLRRGSFKEPSDAQKSVKVWDSAEFRGRKLKAAFWDGVTDYTRVAKEAEESAEGGEEKRIDAFGDWLEDQGELPPELQLRVEE